MENYILSNPADFVLASVLSSYPDQNFHENVKILLKDLKVNTDYESYLLEITSDEKDINILRSEYIDTFDRGQSANPLYETEYGRARAMVKGNELSDIAGFYKAFGLELSEDLEYKEMLDHVAIELEFYALLLMKQIYLDNQKNIEGSEIVFDARKKFLSEHLGRFVTAITNRPGVQSSVFYSKVFNWVNELIDHEALELGITLEKVDWINGEEIKEEITCGGGSCKLK